MLAAAAFGLSNILKDSIQKKANVNYQDKHVVSYHLIIMNDCLLVTEVKNSERLFTSNRS